MNDKTMESNSSKSEWPGQQHVAMLANTGFYYAGISDLFCLFIDFRIENIYRNNGMFYLIAKTTK
jgi:hypothetical protein